MLRGLFDSDQLRAKVASQSQEIARLTERCDAYKEVVKAAKLMGKDGYAVSKRLQQALTALATLQDKTP